jgi:hypothetical protein
LSEYLKDMFKIKNQQGSATFITLAMVIMLAGISAAFITLTSTNLTIAAEFQKGLIAQYAAEAGAQNVLAMFASGSPEAAVVRGDNIALLNFPGTSYQAKISPEPITPMLGQEYKVTITGSYRQAVRVVSFTVAISDTNTQTVSDWYFIDRIGK